MILGQDKPLFLLFHWLSAKNIRYYVYFMK